MLILIVEDDERIARFVARGLEDSGYHTALASDGEEGFLAARWNSYDLIVLDVMLPTMDGVELTRRLRAAGKTAPILMLTARDEERDKIAGLDAGADDYLTKPFSFGEFLARVRALLRRDTLSRAGLMQVGDLELDTAARRVQRGGREISLSAREYGLLEYLMHNVGRVVTRDQLRDAVWSDTETESNVIDVYVRYLRQKIDTSSGQPLIHTVRGIGYTLRAP